MPGVGSLDWMLYLEIRRPQRQASCLKVVVNSRQGWELTTFKRSGLSRLSSAPPSVAKSSGRQLVSAWKLGIRIEMHKPSRRS